MGRSLPKSLRIKDIAARMGFNTTDWARVVMYQECNAFIESIEPETIDVLEISGGGIRRGDRGSSLGHIPPPVFPISTYVRR